MAASEVLLIKKRLIESCLSYEPKAFLPFLLSPVVKIGFPNKVRFYSFFKSIIHGAKEESIGELVLKSEENFCGNYQKKEALNFYDQVHKYPRINLTVEEGENVLIIDIKPF